MQLLPWGCPALPPPLHAHALPAFQNVPLCVSEPVAVTVTPHCQDVCCCDANTKHATALPYAYLYFGGKAALPPGPTALLPRVCFSVVTAPENKGLVLPLPELGAVRIFKSLPPCHHSLLARLLPAPRAASAPLKDWPHGCCLGSGWRGGTRQGRPMLLGPPSNTCLGDAQSRALSLHQKLSLLSLLLPTSKFYPSFKATVGSRH